VAVRTPFQRRSPKCGRKQQMIKPKLHHVTFKTSRLDEMIAWYGAVIGAKVLFRNQVAAWTTNDEANHRIAFLAVRGLSDDEQKTKHNGMHHCAFEYDSFDDLMTSFDRLRKAGIDPAFCFDHGMTISLYYRDPEGNFVELQSDVFGDWTKSADFMRTSPDFAANPIGTFFDPARVYAALKSGADFKTLQKSMRAGDYQPDKIPDIGLPPA
jgi:catechol 2,3-dioxygenase-like lactoylglutathione lyase family enzyme